MKSKNFQAVLFLLACAFIGIIISIFALAAYRIPTVVILDNELKIEENGYFLTMWVGPRKSQRTLYFRNPFEADRYVSGLKSDSHIIVKVKGE